MNDIASPPQTMTTESMRSNPEMSFEHTTAERYRSLVENKSDGFYAFQAAKVQREFFRKVFKRNDASPYEFDLMINMDFIEKPERAADIVETAFRVKFKDEVS
jgi:hypothetical protein